MLISLITRPDRRPLIRLERLWPDELLTAKRRVALHQVREHFSDYCGRICSQSLKATERWLLFRVLAEVNLALRCIRWYPEMQSSDFLLPPTPLFLSVARSK